MAKIYPIENVDFKLPIIKNKDVILNEEHNDSSIIPYRTYRDGIYTYLVYSVNKNGKTLRQFIKDLNAEKPKRSFRQSFRKQLVLHPVDILVQLNKINKEYKAHYSSSLVYSNYQYAEDSNTMRVRFRGSKISGAGINIDSTETVYGGPVVSVKIVNENEIIVQ